MSKVEWILALSDLVLPAIYISAGLCGAAFIACVIIVRDSGKKGASFKSNRLRFSYNAFHMFVSVFPLLGMFGTVLALLGLDFSLQDTSGLQQQFFLALDTTALGLFFSIVFKVLYTLFQATIEDAIDDLDQRRNQDREEHREKKKTN